LLDELDSQFILVRMKLSSKFFNSPYGKLYGAQSYLQVTHDNLRGGKISRDQLYSIVKDDKGLIGLEQDFMKKEDIAEQMPP
jgi:hypothetical protein